jgi:ribosomal protein S19E (S16A)
VDASHVAVVESESGVRAADLCGRPGQERLHVKRNVRKLKSHGLTESLAKGFRLSPRGRSLLDQLEAPADHQ